MTTELQTTVNPFANDSRLSGGYQTNALVDIEAQTSPEIVEQPAPKAQPAPKTKAKAKSKSFKMSVNTISETTKLIEPETIETVNTIGPTAITETAKLEPETIKPAKLIEPTETIEPVNTIEADSTKDAKSNLTKSKLKLQPFK